MDLKQYSPYLFGSLLLHHLNREITAKSLQELIDAVGANVRIDETVINTARERLNEDALRYESLVWGEAGAEICVALLLKAVDLPLSKTSLSNALAKINIPINMNNVNLALTIIATTPANTLGGEQETSARPATQGPAKDAAVVSGDAKRKEAQTSQQALYSVAGSLVRNNMFEEAIVLYSQIIASKPDFASAYFNRAICLAARRRYDEATADARKVLELQPDRPDSYYLMGLMSDHQKNYKDAIDWFNKALEKDPNYQKAKDSIMKVKAKLGQSSQAGQ